MRPRFAAACRARCSPVRVYKRSPPDHGVEPIAVLFTADSLGDPKGVLRTDKNTTAAVDHVVAALGMTAETKVLVGVPLFHAYGWDIGFLPTLKLGCTMFPRRRSVGAPHRQADPRARDRHLAGHARDVRRPHEDAGRQEARGQGPALPRRRLAPRSIRRGRLLQRVRRARHVLLPLDRGGDRRARRHRQVSDDGRQADRRRRGSRHRRGRQGREGRLDLGQEQDALAQVDRPVRRREAEHAGVGHGRDRRDRQGRLAAHRRSRQDGQERSPRDHRSRRRRGQGRRQARRARRGRRLSRGIPEDQGRAGDGDHRPDGGARWSSRAS